MKYTILERRDGMGLYIAQGEWNSPHDAMEGMREKNFVRLSSIDAEIIDRELGPFRAGEYDVIDGELLPVIATTMADEAAKFFRRRV